MKIIIEKIDAGDECRFSLEAEDADYNEINKVLALVLTLNLRDGQIPQPEKNKIAETAMELISEAVEVADRSQLAPPAAGAVLN